MYVSTGSSANISVVPPVLRCYNRFHMKKTNMFDKVSEKAVDVLSSAPVIVLFTIWLIVHNLFPFIYVNFISDVAIEIGLLILRAENVQSERLEKKIDKKH